jgi:hypothetical protein
VAIDDPRKLAQTLGELKVGSAVKLTAMRDGKAQTIELTLGERPVFLWDMPWRRTGGGPAGTTSAPVRGGIATGRTILF